jgi:hypothetical protein
MGLTANISYTGTKADLIDTLHGIEREYRTAKKKAEAGAVARVCEMIEHWTIENYEPPVPDGREAREGAGSMAWDGMGSGGSGA